MIDAASRFQLSRLPEVFAGTSRLETPFPVQSLGANVPQARAAESVFNLLQALVGLLLDVETETLYADPWLPDWFPEIRVSGMTLMGRATDLRIWRDSGETRIAITRGDHIRIVRHPFALHGEVGTPPGYFQA